MSVLNGLLTLRDVIVPPPIPTRDAIAPTPASMAGEVFSELWPYCCIVVVAAVAVIIIVRQVKKKRRAAQAAQEKPEETGDK